MFFIEELQWHTAMEDSFTQSTLIKTQDKKHFHAMHYTIITRIFPCYNSTFTQYLTSARTQHITAMEDSFTQSASIKTQDNKHFHAMHYIIITSIFP